MKNGKWLLKNNEKNILKTTLSLSRENRTGSKKEKKREKKRFKKEFLLLDGVNMENFG